MASCSNEVSYTVHFDTNGGTAIESMQINKENIFIMPNQPEKVGSVFSGWYLDNDSFLIECSENYFIENPISTDITLYAKWIVVSYTIAFDSNEGSTVPSLTQDYGTIINAPDNPAKTGYVFSGWHIDQELTQLYGFSTMPAENITLYAKWTIAIITMTFNSNGGSQIDPIIQTYGMAFSVPVQPIKEGYTFIGWYSDEELTKNYDFLTIPAEDITLYAKWTIDTITMTFNSNGGSHIDPIIQTYGTTFIAPIQPTKEGHTFFGWYSDEELTQNYDFLAIPSKNITLHAKWLMHNASYRVNYYLENLDDSFTVVESNILGGITDLTVSAPLIEYIGFEIDLSHENTIFSGMITGEELLVLNLYYIRDVYEVLFVDDNETLIHLDLVKYLDTAHAPSDPNRIGYTFSGWNQSLENITENITVKALYHINTYTLSYDSAGGNEIPEVIEPYNTKILLPIPTKMHYDFKGWLMDSEIIIELYLTDDMQVTATWELTQYKIIMNPNGGIEMEDLIVTYGQVIEEFIHPIQLDYVFDGWYYNEVAVNLPFTFNQDHNIEFIASWKGLAEGVSYVIIEDEVKITSYSGTESILVLPDTISKLPITTIGEGAFANNTTIESLTFGSYVTTIEDQAFYQMTNLKYLQLSALTQSIGSNVLYGSNQLEHLVVSSEASYQLKHYFGNNINFVPATLNTLEFAEGSNVIDNTITSNNLIGITNIIFAKDTLTIPENIIMNNPFIQSIYLPEGLLTIEANAFYGLTGLISLTLPNSLISIGTNAFYGASSLTSLFIPNSVTSIGASAFSSASNLTSIVIPNSVTSIGDSAFSGASNLTSITIPFVGQSRLLTSTNTSFGYIFGTSIYSNSYLANGYYLPTTLQEVVITDATGIGASAFHGAINLTSIVIPYGVNSIGASAFYGVSSLQSIEIPSTVTSIGASAFYGASNLLMVTFGSDSQLNSIGASAFYGATQLESIEIPSLVKTIGDLAFRGASSLTSITIPNSVTSMGANVFFGASSLSSISIPFVGQSRSVTGVNASFGYIFGKTNYTGSYIANGYYLPTTLKEVIVTDATNIGIAAFQGASSISSVLILSNITSIGSNAFYGATGLTSMVVPKSVSSIGAAAFRGANNLASITLPFIGQSRTATGLNSYFGFIFGTSSYENSYLANGYYLPTKLKEVIITDSTNIGASAFLGASSLSKVVIPDSVTSIGSSAFLGATSLTKIVIPNSVTNIGSQAFDTNNLSIFVGVNNRPSDWNINWVIHGATIIWGYKETVTINGVDYALSNNNVAYVLGSDFENVSIEGYIHGHEVIEIASGAFKDHENIKYVYIPNTIHKIGNYAFNNTENLATVEFEAFSQLIQIGSYAFYDAKKINSLEISSNVINIGSKAFNNEYLTLFVNMNNKPNGWEIDWITSDATIIWGYKETVTIDGVDYALSNNHVAYVLGSTIEEVILNNTIDGHEVIEIVSGAFNNDMNIQYIFIPDTIRKIGNFAFQGAENLVIIQFEELSQLSKIGIGAFQGAINLNGIIIPIEVTNIGANAFLDANSVIIHAEVEEKPNGWDSTWNASNRPVLWGYTKN